MVAYELEHLLACQRIDRLVLATAYHHSEDILTAVVRGSDFRVFRRGLEDVLELFRACSARSKPPRWCVSEVVASYEAGYFVDEVLEARSATAASIC